MQNCLWTTPQQRTQDRGRRTETNCNRSRKIYASIYSTCCFPEEGSHFVNDLGSRDFPVQRVFSGGSLVSVLLSLQYLFLSQRMYTKWSCLRKVSQKVQLSKQQNKRLPMGLKVVKNVYQKKINKMLIEKKFCRFFQFKCIGQKWHCIKHQTGRQRTFNIQHYLSDFQTRWRLKIVRVQILLVPSCKIKTVSFHTTHHLMDSCYIRVTNYIHII